jgi:hypothetical protein
MTIGVDCCNVLASGMKPTHTQVAAMFDASVSNASCAEIAAVAITSTGDKSAYAKILYSQCIFLKTVGHIYDTCESYEGRFLQSEEDVNNVVAIRINVPPAEILEEAVALSDSGLLSATEDSITSSLEDFGPLTFDKCPYAPQYCDGTGRLLDDCSSPFCAWRVLVGIWSGRIRVEFWFRMSGLSFVASLHEWMARHCNIGYRCSHIISLRPSGQFIICRSYEVAVILKERCSPVAMANW